MDAGIAGTQLRVREKLAYASGNLGLGIVLFMTSTYLLYFYSDYIGLSPALVGVALMIGRVWDAVSDPMMGLISDRTRSRWGRRRVFLLLASVPLGVLFFFTWSPPGFLTDDPGMGLFVYLTVIWILLMTAYTVVAVPYYSLGAEISSDPDQRSSAFAFSNMGYRIGQLIAIAAANAALEFADSVVEFLHFKVGLFSDNTADALVSYFANPTNAVRFVGGVFSVLLVAAILLSFLGTKERLRPEPEERVGGLVGFGKSFLGELLQRVKNKRFRILIISQLIADANMGIVFASLPYVAKYWLEVENYLTIVFLAVIICGIFFAFLWVRVSKTKGKRWVFLAAQLIYALTMFAMIPIGAGQPWWFLAMCVLLALGIAGYVMVWSLIADIADYEEYRTRKRREGSLYGIYTLSSKAAQAVGVALTGFVIGAIGFRAGAKVSPDMILALKLFFTLGAGGLNLMGFLVFWFFPYDRQEHRRIQQELEERKRPEAEVLPEGDVATEPATG